MEKFNFKKEIECWGVQEICVKGVRQGNPFKEQWIWGRFINEAEEVKVRGFYDGEGRYIVRFMPSFQGGYQFEIRASFLEGNLKGEFEAVKPKEGNHGIVRVRDTFHFAYADGTPYYSLGTTCYVWELQSDEVIEKTFQTLAKESFNKIRFCIFPKHYDYNLGEPRNYPYEGKPMDSSILTKENFLLYQGDCEGNQWDFSRFIPEYFRHIEKCIERLGDMGIEADLILMHPYDRWGFSEMPRWADELYLKYVIARFAAYRNVWWALANEYDLMSAKTEYDWEHYAEIICKEDVYGHLRSIHNCHAFYDHSRKWITHCSIQRQDLYKSGELTDEWRGRYQKPIVMDEIAYEGNIQHGWGNITAEEMLRRFWETICRGGYPGHGETYLDKDEGIWWSHGGKLRGESYKRFKLIKEILLEAPGGLKPYEKKNWDEVCAVPEREASGSVYSYYLFYYSFMRPSFREFYFDDTQEFEVEIIDTWEMERKSIGIYKGRFQVILPGKPYMAILIRRWENN